MPFWETYGELVITNLRLRIQKYITIANYIISEVLELFLIPQITVIPFK